MYHLPQSLINICHNSLTPHAARPVQHHIPQQSTTPQQSNMPHASTNSITSHTTTNFVTINVMQLYILILCLHAPFSHCGSYVSSNYENKDLVIVLTNCLIGKRNVWPTNSQDASIRTIGNGLWWGWLWIQTSIAGATIVIVYCQLQRAKS